MSESEVKEKKNVSLVYFGRKRPKMIQTVPPDLLEIAKEEDRVKHGLGKGGGVNFVPLEGKVLKYNFQPFKALDVHPAVAKILLNCAGDIFQRVDEERKGKPEPRISTSGYVGAQHAERIKNLTKRVAAEIKSEEGKSIEEVISDSSKKGR